jgi:hypothetical protein
LQEKAEQCAQIAAEVETIDTRLIELHHRLSQLPPPRVRKRQPRVRKSQANPTEPCRFNLRS